MSPLDCGDATYTPAISSNPDTTNSQAAAPSRTYLNNSFAEKDAVKALGAQFDGTAKRWYVPPGADRAPFARWLGSSSGASSSRSGASSSSSGASTS